MTKTTKTAQTEATQLYIEDLGTVTGGVFTTSGAEGGGPPRNTGVVAETGGNAPPTSFFGEDGGSKFTTLALGEEGSAPSMPTTLALGEEGNGTPVIKPL
jgi:hypothetical protein